MFIARFVSLVFLQYMGQPARNSSTTNDNEMYECNLKCRSCPLYFISRRSLDSNVHLILKVRPVFQNILRHLVFLRGFLAVIEYTVLF
jgi:hypothetical protein